MLTMQQLYYLPELVLFKALKSSSKSPQNLELSFFEYKSCRALENSCFLDLNEISWLYKQESIIFFLNLFRFFFIFVCCKAVMLLFLFHIINKAFHFNCLIAIIIVQVYLVQQSRYTSTFWCFIYISSVHFIYACSVLSMIW